MDPSSPVLARAPSATRAAALAGTRPFWWIAAGAAFLIASRLLLSPAISWDHSEQLVWSQQLAWGYGPQPPLYTWLQWAVGQVLGPTLLSLAVVKNGLIALTFAFMFLAARQIMPTPTAWLTALGLIWLPGVGWSLMRDQTHTVMLNAAIAATWWALLRQIRAPSPMGFALLGVLMAWGVLSKYSYVLVAAAAVLAALSLREPRRALLSRGWWLTPLITLALVAPHAAWMIRHWHSASASTLHKLQPPDTVSRLQGLGSGLGDLLVFAALAVLPWLLMARWAFGPPWRTLRAGCSSRIQREVCAAGRDEIRGARRSDGHSHREDEQRSRSPDSADAHVAAIREEHSEGGDDQTLVLLKRYMALVLAPLLLMVLAGTSSFEGRWIQPLLLALPLLALAARPQAGLQPRAVKRFLCACVAMGVLLWAIVMSAPLLDAKRGKSDRLNWPVATIGQAMRAAGVDGQGVVIVGHHTLGGIVRMQFPEAQVVVCNIESKDTNACVRREAQRALAQGWRLTLAQADDPAPDPWWRAAWPADTAMPALHSVVLPYRWTDPKKQRLFLDVMPGPVPQAVAQGAMACTESMGIHALPLMNERKWPDTPMM